MFFKIIFVLATVYVVNASVISDNVSDDVISENTLSDLEDLVSLKEDDPDTEVASNPKGCNYRECDQRCRRLKFPGGVCVNGRCKCDNFLNADDEMTDPAEITSPGDCNFRACARQCSELGFPGGACVNGRCKCDNFLNTEVSESNVEDSVPSRACNNQKCNQLCRKKKFRGGACLGANCYCNKFLSLLEDEVSEESLPVSDLSEDQPERGCNMQACDQLFRRHKFSGGACVNGRCKCDNFFGTEVAAVDEYSEFAPGRICDLRRCNRTCTRRGYEDARCVNGRCKCYNKIQRQDTYPLNDVRGDENEESNVILRTNEEELIVPSARACNTVNCNQMCHRLNYAGGWCRFGKCQCY